MPLRAFLRTESGSAMVLVAGIAAAMIWANASDADYESFWHAKLSIRGSSASPRTCGRGSTAG